MSLTVATGILRAVNAAADAFPPLKSVTGGALFIAETVQKFKRSKEEWNRLSERIQTYVAIVMKSLHEDGSRKQDWTQSLKTLNNALSSIKTKIEDLQNQKRLKQWQKHLNTDGEVVQELQTEFDNAIQLCQFQVTMTSTSEILEQLRGASAREIVERLLRTFKEEIASEIDWSAAFARLPDPIGTSWNPARACLPGTRDAHLAEISSWISTVPNRPDGTAEIFLVADALGSGKTTLAHAVCALAHSARHLVASFFFSRQDVERTTPRNLFASIIRGLGDVDKVVKKDIAQRLNGDSTLATAALTRQFNEVILPVCHILPTNRPFVIVIDALDEGYDKDLLIFLCDSVPLLPYTFRVVITSRPEERIMAKMNKIHICRCSSTLSGIENRDDITKFIDNKIRQAEWGSEVSPELRASFITKTEGLFLWAATALNHVDNLYDPCSELQNLIDNSSESWSGGKDAKNKLDNLYHQILSSFEWNDKKFVRAYKLIMGAIVTLKEPLSPIGLSSLYATQSISTKDIARICSCMQTFLINFDRNSLDRPIHLLHWSVQEYLTKRAPSPYRLGEEDQHGMLANCCLKTINNELDKANVPRLGYTEGDWDLYHIPWITKLERGNISEELWYSCWFFEDHLLVVESGQVSSSLAQMTVSTLSKAKVGWLLETTASMGKVTDLGLVRWWAMNKRILHEDNGWHNTSDRELSAHINNMSFCLRQSGRIEEALKLSESAVEINRQIAESHSGRLRPGLASSLHALSNALGSLGRLSDALSAIEEASQIYRHLAVAQPARFEAVLTVSLNCLSVCLGNLDRHAEALAAIEEAIEINRRLAANKPTVFDPFLATSLNNLSYCLDKCGQLKEALTANEEAVVIRRRLAVEQPDAFEPKLAKSLYNLSIRLYQLGQHADAFRAIEESVEIRRRLAELQPAAFEVDFAESLHILSHRLSMLERHTEALRAAEDVVEIHRRLAADQPTRFNTKLANRLRLLSRRLVALGRQEDALKATQEANLISS